MSLTDDIAEEFDLKVKRGSYILSSEDDSQPSIVAGSPAEKAGLKEGDIITKVNNVKIDNKTSLSSALSGFQVGETIKLTVTRGDETLTLNATLAAAPSN